MNKFTLYWIRHGVLNELNFSSCEEAQLIKNYLQGEYSIPDAEMSIVENANYEQSIHLTRLNLGDIL
jgi:hypothetical protein